MQKIRQFIRRRPVFIYFVLTIVLTWGGMALAVYPGGFPITEAQMETAGALVYVAMLVGPTGAACLLIGLLDGRSGFRELASRLTRWRVEGALGGRGAAGPAAPGHDDFAGAFAIFACVPASHFHRR